MGLEEFLDAMFIGLVKGTTFVLVRKKLENNEKTTLPAKQFGGFFKKIFKK